jgi:hypothetical protein
MIPVLIFGGLVVGRWWAVLVAALVWPAILAAKRIGSSVPFFLGAAASRSKPTASKSNSERQ